MRRTKLLFLAVTCLAVGFLASEPALAERRVALVVGNSSYKNTIQLLNPANDAKDVAAKLRGLGFDVIEKVDIDKRGWDLALQEFERRLPDSEAALFYFAGHGMQFRGTNFLMPVDAQLTDEVSLDYEMIEIERIKRALDRAGRGVKIMVLDACRNNPLADRLARSIVGASRDFGQVRGFTRVARAEGTVVAYATQSNEVAQDGAGRNSPYTAALLARLDEPGLEIGSLFRRVSGDVRQKTKGQQSPELSISLDHDFYLNTSETAAMAWARLNENDKGDPKVLRDFLARFPASAQAPDAQYRLGILETEITKRRRETEERIAKEQEEAALRARLAREEEDRKEAERQRLAALQRERVARDDETARLAREVQEQRERAEEAEQQKLAAIEKARAAQEAADRIVKEKDEKLRLAREADEQRKRADRAGSQVTDAQEKARKAEEAADRIAKEMDEKEKARLIREAEDQRKRADEAERKILEAKEKLRAAEDAADRSKAEARRHEAELERKAAEAKAQQLAALEQQRADRENSLSAPTQRAIEAPDLVRNAQVALKILGCYSGTATGTLDGATTQAIKTYLARTGREGREASVTKDLVDELEKPAVHGTTCIDEPTGSKVKRAKLHVPDHVGKPDKKGATQRRQAEPAAAKPRVPRVMVESQGSGSAPKASRPSVAPAAPKSAPSLHLGGVGL